MTIGLRCFLFRHDDFILIDLYEVHEVGNDVASFQNVMRSGVAESATRHLGRGSLVWILDNGNAATLLDGKKAHRAVVEAPAENDSNHPRAVNAGGRPKQGIDGGPVTVLPGAAQDTHSARLDGEVGVGTGDVDMAAPDRFLI